MNFRFIRCLLSAGFILFAAAGCGGKQREAEIPAGAKKVKTITVQFSQVAGAEQIPGNVKSATMATIEAKIAGRITKLHFKEGDVAVGGQLLVEIDAHETQAKLDQALASQRQTEQDLKRYARLLPTGAITSQEYDNVLAKAKVADASVAEARALVSYTRVDAPFDALITRKLAEEGDLALPGKPLLTLEKRDLYQFETDVPETLATELAVGAVLRVSLSGTEAQLSGSISEISPISDPSSRTRRIKIDLPANPQLRSGQFGYALVPSKKRPELRIPAGALIERGQLESVLVLDQGYIRLRLVRSGKRDADSIEILSGLRDGEKIIHDTGDLADGDKAEEEQ